MVICLELFAKFDVKNKYRSILKQLHNHINTIPSWVQLPSKKLKAAVIQQNLIIYSEGLVAYDPRRHQGMTQRCKRSRHPRASSPHEKQRRRMPIFATPREDFVLPHSELVGMDLSFPSYFPRLWTFWAARV